MAFMGQRAGKALSVLRPKVIKTGDKMGLPWKAYYVLTKSHAQLTNAKVHPNSGSPNYNIAHNVSDLIADAGLDLGAHDLTTTGNVKFDAAGVLQLSANPAIAYYLQLNGTGGATTQRSISTPASFTLESYAGTDGSGDYDPYIILGAAADGSGVTIGNDTTGAAATRIIALRGAGGVSLTCGGSSVTLKTDNTTLTRIVQFPDEAGTFIVNESSISHTNIGDIGTNTHAQIDTHISGDGSDHTFIDQNVTTSGTPSFAGMTLTGDLTVSNAWKITGGYVMIGSGGTVSQADADGDLWVEHELEIRGPAYFYNQIRQRAGSSSQFGETVAGGYDMHFRSFSNNVGEGLGIQDGGTTQRYFYIGVTPGSNYWETNDVILCIKSDGVLSTDFAHGRDANPRFYVQSASGSGGTDEYVRLMHDQTDGLIEAGSGDLVLSPDVRVTGDLTADTIDPGALMRSDVFWWYDDFVGDTIEHKYVITAGVALRTDEIAGVVRLTTTAANGNFRNITGGTDFEWLKAAKDFTWEIRAQLSSTASVGAYPLNALSGFNVVQLRYDTSVPDTNWQLVTSATVTDSGVAPDTDWHTYKVVVSGTGTQVDFYIDGDLKCTSTTNIPTQDLAWQIAVYTRTTASKYMNVDYIKMWQNR